MGEANRKKGQRTAVEQAAMELTQKLAKDGMLLMGGFSSYIIIHGISPDDTRIPAMFDLYMSGAEHLWSSIMTTLDPQHEVTDADLQRMDGIEKEMEKFRERKRADMASMRAAKAKADFESALKEGG